MSSKIKIERVINVLVLTGVCGVGKSTIGKLWAKAKKGVCIECDCFTSWIYDKHPIATDYFLKVEPMIAKLAWQACKEYYENGFSVAIENVWTPKGLTQLKEAFDNDGISAKFIYLSCDLEENKQRDLLRSSDCQMNERVAIVHSELSSYDWPSFVHRLDTSGQLSTETLSKILSLENNYDKIKIEKVINIPFDGFESLKEESQKEGFRFLERLETDWINKENQFNKGGESLFALKKEEQLIGLGGINNNPFNCGGKVGRLRRFYISNKYRGQGYGTKLLNHIVKECYQAYDIIHLYTDNPQACLFYEMNGFKKVENIEKVSHTLEVIKAYN